MNTPKEQQKDAIRKKLNVKLGGRPPTEKDKREQAALVDILAGDKEQDVLQKFAVHPNAVARLLAKIFPTNEEKWEFLENCNVVNSVLASAQFQQTYTLMSPIEAAKASVIFAGKALDIRKAREAGFKEAPISIALITSLQQTLQNQTP